MTTATIPAQLLGPDETSRVFDMAASIIEDHGLDNTPMLIAGSGDLTLNYGQIEAGGGTVEILIRKSGRPNLRFMLWARDWFPYTDQRFDPTTSEPLFRLAEQALEDVRFLADKRDANPGRRVRQVALALKALDRVRYDVESTIPGETVCWTAPPRDRERYAWLMWDDAMDGAEE
jgi:hypothetical protein